MGAVRVLRDVKYGAGGIGYPDATTMRDLLLNAYLPEGNGHFPAVVMAFGGAFHRGSKEADSVEYDGRSNTDISDYCRRLAEKGYACFSVGYRLTQEGAPPSDTPVLTAPGDLSRTRMDAVRKILGLPAATPEELARGVEGAIDDVSAAIDFVRRNAEDYGVDPERIAAGGFSAGATSALYAAFGHRTPVAALVILSGRLETADIVAYLGPDAPRPPALHITGETDLEYVLRLTPEMIDRYRRIGLEHIHWSVPGHGHFYPCSATAIDAVGHRRTVDDVVLSFLAEYLAPVTAAA